MVALCAVFILIQVFFDLQIPSYMNDMTMALQTGSDLGAVSDYGLKMALCAFASLAAAIGTVYMAAKVGSTLGRNLRLKLFDKIKTFTPQDTVKFSSASLITRTTNDVVQVQTFAAMALSIIIKAPIMAIWALSRISGGSWEWTAATAAGLLAIFLGVFGMHKFYLGYNQTAFIMLTVSIVGSIFTIGLAAAVIWVIAIIEGVMYLAKSQTEFDEIYVKSKREWF